MINEKLNRATAVMLTAILLFSSLVILPQVNVSAASETNEIIIGVIDSDGIVKNATVKLTEVHTGKIYYASFSEDISRYVAAGASSGYYIYEVSEINHYTDKNTSGFRFYGTQQHTVTNTVELTKFGQSWYQYSVRVNDTLGNPISGATVKFYDHNEIVKQEITSNTTKPSNKTNVYGNTIVDVIGGIDLDLVVTALNYEMSVTNIGIISSSGSMDIVLNRSSVVQGFVYKESSGTPLPASNVVAYMYNTNSSIPWEKRVLRSAGGYVRFDAYPGSWIMVVDGSDVDPYVAAKTVGGSEIVQMILPLQNQSKEDVTITMSDWNNLDLYVSSIWRADKVYYGLDYADSGCLRAQIDLSVATQGNADGTISVTEWGLFASMLVNHGPDYVTTSSIMHADDGNDTNSTQYVSISSSPLDYSVTVSSFTGLVTLKTNITYTSDMSYTSQTTLPSVDSFYNVDFVFPYDSRNMNRSFQIILVNDYEAIKNTTLSTKVIVRGYETLLIDPQLSLISGSGTVVFDIEKSEGPTVVAKIDVDNEPDNVFIKRVNETNQTILYYVVRNNTEVVFSSEDCSDPNGNPLDYTWDLGDGTTFTNIRNTTVKHNYTAGAHNLSVSLTVEDVTGRTNSTTIIVSVDAKLPRVTLNVYNMTYGLKSGSIISIDQHESLKFNGNGTVDDLRLLNDGLGEILWFEWKFGNGTPKRILASETENLTVTHEFDESGDIPVVMNVTDVVGNWNNKTVTIRVSDLTAPTIVIGKLLNDTWGTSLIEKRAVYLDATDTTDNVDEIADMHFEWIFGDGSAKINGTGSSFANVTHNYTSYGKYTLVLNVTDSSSNNATKTMDIYIGSGPRPNIEPIKITFEPTQFEEGVTGRITVNITNDGSADATGVIIELWYYSGTQAQERIGNITKIYQNGSQISSLGIGESAYGYFDWTPDTRGNWTIRAVTNCTDQKQSNWEVSSVEVKEAGWKQLALIIGILVIIVVVPLILIARKRIASSSGMRRSKPEKEKKKEKEKESD